MDASAKWLHQNTRLWTRSYLRCGYADLMSPIMTLGYGKASMITGWFLNWVVFPKLPLNLKRLQPLTKSLSLSRFLHLHQNCSPHKIRKFLSLPCHDTHVRPSSLFFQASTFRRRGKALSNLPLLRLLATNLLSRLIELGRREKVRVPTHVRSLRFVSQPRIFQWRWFGL